MISILASVIRQSRAGAHTLGSSMTLRNHFYVHDWSHIYDGIYKF